MRLMHCQLVFFCVYSVHVLPTFKGKELLLEYKKLEHTLTLP